MNRPTQRILMLLAVAWAAAGLHLRAAAEPLPEPEAQKVREVIVAQLSALALDDADKAFETATPEVRAAIGTPTRFLALVRAAYPMVYRPASVSFHRPEQEDGGVLQMVEIRDDDDKAWLALFALERQPDQSWRISGCVVAENHWQTT
ncbi:DUF4864 domain-containing protein [Ramlibacter tataouinensis]|uniref:DUF4864 domain-containing protein n=1 Tax=Ramlibacter tataouinensis TaxID=94132 RepID=UPI0022F3B2B4|nr:DUF4864 domain-containing protein [Ramlibacter tataouinensis]WBY00967.1 DUF4864 domain-containing protein [Ramlibacter tataouinensis]